MALVDFNPSHDVRLRRRMLGDAVPSEEDTVTYLAMNLELLDSGHGNDAFGLVDP